MSERDEESGGAAQSLFEQLQREQADKSLPPVEKWAPEQEGEIDIRLARDGTWYHEGTPIRRSAMVRLFATILRRDDDAYFLVTPGEKLRIQVDDAPFVAVRLEREGQGRSQRLMLSTNVDEHVRVDEAHPLKVEHRDGEPSPYVHVRSNLWALLTRNVYYELADLAVADERAADSRLGVWSCGAFYRLE